MLADVHIYDLIVKPATSNQQTIVYTIVLTFLSSASFPNPQFQSLIPGP